MKDFFKFLWSLEMLLWICPLYTIDKGGWVAMSNKKLTCQDNLTIFGPKVNQITCNKVTGFIISGST